MYELAPRITFTSMFVLSHRLINNNNYNNVHYVMVVVLIPACTGSVRDANLIGFLTRPLLRTVSSVSAYVTS